MPFNDFAAQILRSPLYWMMGKGTLLITLTGRKSGNSVTLPVNFFPIDGDFWVTSLRSRVWWRNLESNPRVTLWVNGKRRQAAGELILDEKTVTEKLTRICALEPMLARAFRVRLENGIPNPDDMQRVAADRLLVRLKMDD